MLRPGQSVSKTMGCFSASRISASCSGVNPLPAVWVCRASSAMVYSPFFGRSQPGGNYPRVPSGFFRVYHKKNRPGFSDCLTTLFGFGTVIIPPFYVELPLARKTPSRLFHTPKTVPDCRGPGQDRPLYVGPRAVRNATQIRCLSPLRLCEPAHL
jgi:hypothetical protein